MKQLMLVFMCQFYEPFDSSFTSQIVNKTAEPFTTSYQYSNLTVLSVHSPYSLLPMSM